MKNKKKTYLLLIVVLGVWGMIGYRIWAGLNPDAPKIVQQDVTVAFSPKTNLVIDTFSIQPLDRDPFLGTLSHKKIKKARPRTQIKKSINWVPIQYHGMIAKQNKKEQVFIVTIEGTQHLMKIGHTIKGVKLMRGNSSDIYVSFKGEKKKINKI